MAFEALGLLPVEDTKDTKKSKPVEGKGRADLTFSSKLSASPFFVSFVPSW